MDLLISLGLYLATNIVLCYERCGDYIPSAHPLIQPDTFCSPAPFNWNCSSIIPGSTWHFLNGYLTWGRCCQPVYGMNGTFRECSRNGESDILTDCEEGLHNWNSPFSSVDRPYPYEHSISVCKPQTKLTDSNIPRVTWKQREYITRHGQSVTLLAQVNSSTKVAIASLFRDHKIFPVKSTNVTFKLQQGDYVAFTLTNVTTADDGAYFAVATNTRASGWSGPVHLTVLSGETGQNASGSSPTRCMFIFVGMVCMIQHFICGRLVSYV
ncbi:uncharacterized protein LOC117323946 isoform X1 [Pecten maximus]|uniref:uncharacterized protein LOC117323946 isoform X1 n=1 Tax=Pecten maximus TaxID=6579 RepID=UPI0014580234|nr:uncharacterized protein LOC117323946 isoform X1 [Pecten maximus]XP_033735377.1 uncharacterized protein LOC117323946 isoform X1 [Pecten maximus]XP_033735378.1 uncharacterized protein LOC117323946 isoform X1 [Pecten maximus]